MFTVGIILFDDFEELDAIGPWEVFRVAEELLQEKKGENLTCEMTSLWGEKVIAKKGLRLDVHNKLTKDSRYDLILLPGGEGSRAIIADEAAMETITHVAGHSSWVTSVCTGSLVYAAAGLLKNKKCTSHHMCLEMLKQISPTSDVISNSRFVQDGNMVTSAGVSAGIDMSLWLVGQIFSPELARKVQHFMEYYPKPPYAD